MQQKKREKVNPFKMKKSISFVLIIREPAKRRAIKLDKIIQKKNYNLLNRLIIYYKYL